MSPETIAPAEPTNPEAQDVERDMSELAMYLLDAMATNPNRKEYPKDPIKGIHSAFTRLETDSYISTNSVVDEAGQETQVVTVRPKATTEGLNRTYEILIRPNYDISKLVRLTEGDKAPSDTDTTVNVDDSPAHEADMRQALLDATNEANVR